MPESILDYLRRVHREPVPRWLEEDDFSLDRFFLNPERSTILVLVPMEVHLNHLIGVMLHTASFG